MLNGSSQRRTLRCAIYTRKSSEEGLEQAFNSLDAQREACAAYVKSQAHEGWRLIPERYDDGGQSGGTLERPGLQRLLAAVEARQLDVIVVYKIDRLTRALVDFAKLAELFEAHGVSFVAVTQQFNTTSSMGRLTLNVLLSFAQFEREVAGERIRDKIAASKRKGMWMGGVVPLGYEAGDRTLVINPAEAETVRTLFRLYLELGNVRRLQAEAARLGLTTKARREADGQPRSGRPLSRGHLYTILRNPLYAVQIAHKGQRHPGRHPALIQPETWEAAAAGGEPDRGADAHERRGAEPARRLAARRAGPSLHALACGQDGPALPLLCRSPADHRRERRARATAPRSRRRARGAGARRGAGAARGAAASAGRPRRTARRAGG